MTKKRERSWMVLDIPVSADGWIFEKGIEKAEMYQDLNREVR